LAVRYEQNSSGIRIFQDMTTRRARATATSNGEFDSQLMMGNNAQRLRAMAKSQQTVTLRFFISTTVSVFPPPSIENDCVLGRVPNAQWKDDTLAKLAPRGHIPSAQQSPRAPNVVVHVASFLLSYICLQRFSQSLPFRLTLTRCSLLLLLFRFSELSRQQFLEIFVLELLLRSAQVPVCTIPAGVPVTKDHQGVEQS